MKPTEGIFHNYLMPSCDSETADLCTDLVKGLHQDVEKIDTVLSPLLPYFATKVNRNNYTSVMRVGHVRMSCLVPGGGEPD